MDRKRTAAEIRRWDEGEAREALAEQQRSGESITAFAQRRGFSAQRIYYWKKRIAGGAVPAFVAVPVAPASAAKIEIVADGVTIRIREDVAPERLAQIVDVLGRRSRVC
jgi:transposase-like protein